MVNNTRGTSIKGTTTADNTMDKLSTRKQVIAAIKRKQADLDEIDDQLMDMPEMDPNAPLDIPTSSEFDLLSEKREELENEIHKMREGVQLISEWEKFKGGQWSDEIKEALNGIDVEITDAAGGSEALAQSEESLSIEPLDTPDTPDSPDSPDSLDMEDDLDVTEDETSVIDEPVTPAPVPSPVVSSVKSKNNNYQTLDKKSFSSSKKEIIMANQTNSKPLKEKLAEVKSKREAIKKEAQQRVAAAWTIAKTMLPEAPVAVQKQAAVTMLQNSTPVLNAMLRQTAKNGYYTKLAESNKVHKEVMNDPTLMGEGENVDGLKKEVASELKGDPKSAAVKKADDRKECGEISGEYNDGRKGSEPKELDASKAGDRKDDTINKSAKKDKKKEEEEKEKKDKKDKKDKKKKASCTCENGKCKCAASCEECTDDKDCKKHASVKKAAEGDEEEPKKEETPEEVEETTEVEEETPEGEEEVEETETEEVEPPAELPPADEVPAEDNAAEVISDEKKEVVEEKIEEVKEAINALEKEILDESAEGEELDYANIFNEDNMDEKADSLANEDEDNPFGDEEGFDAPEGDEDFVSPDDELEDGLDDHMASMEDFFSLRGSNSDPLAHLIAGEIRTAADVAGMDVIPSSTGEAANEFEQSDSESRDNESDHEGDLFAEAIGNVTPEKGDFKRVKQDSTNELQEPKAAGKKPAVIKKLKPIVASDARPVDIASALFGNDEF